MRPPVTARQKALNLLARREYSRLELESKLKLKKFDSEEIQSILNELAEKNWQSDERFAEMFVRTSINNGHGPIKIRQKLKEKGVTPPIIEQALNDWPGNWSEHLEAVLKKRYPNNLSSSEEKQKCARFLWQRGFSQEQIWQVIW